MCTIDIYSKYPWFVPLKDKRAITIAGAFKKMLDEFNHKPNNIWVDKGSEFYNRSMKSWLQYNDIETNSTHNERKSVIGERFVKTFKNKFYKDMN